MILLLTGCSESKKLSTNQSEDNNQIKYKSKDNIDAVVDFIVNNV